MSKIYLLAALLACTALQACAPLVVGGALVGGTMMASDRRTVGAQTEDQGIEFKALNALSNVLDKRSNVSATSFNRRVLLTGEAITEADLKLAEDTVAKLANVRNVVNELAVMTASSVTTRGNDSFITGKVKASMVDAKDIFANSFKVITERGIVYLLGIVTDREGQRGAEIASRVLGVQRVIKVLEPISEDDLKRMSMDPSNSKLPPPKTSGQASN